MELKNIENEVSVTTGYVFQNKTPVKAKSAKRTFDFFSQEPNFDIHNLLYSKALSTTWEGYIL